MNNLKYTRISTKLDYHQIRKHPLLNINIASNKKGNVLKEDNFMSINEGIWAYGSSLATAYLLEIIKNHEFEFGPITPAVWDTIPAIHTNSFVPICLCIRNEAQILNWFNWYLIGSLEFQMIWLFEVNISKKALMSLMSN